MPEQGRYGRVRIVTIIRDFNDLRKAIRNHDSEATEAAWERCERWLGFVVGSASQGQNTSRNRKSEAGVDRRKI